MILNKNCYHALALGKDEYAYCKAVDDFTLCGERDFTFSIQFLPTAVGQEIVLFYQKGVLKIGWRKGAFYYETKVAGTIMSEQWSMPILENEWNQFDLTCIDGRLTFYINGMEGYSEKIVVDGTIGSSTYQIGQVFEGYLRYVRIANFGMDSVTLVANQYQNNLETSQMELYFDFSKRKVRDFGCHNISVLLSGLSEVKDIVRVFCPGKSGMAIPAASEEINPGGFKTGQFTLYQRVFLQYVDADCIVIANGSLTKGVVLAVTADCHMKAVWNGLDYVANRTLPTYQWLDLAVSFDGKTLRFYVNGVPDAEFAIEEEPAALEKGNIQIGNVLVNGRTISGKSFRGYFDCAAIFDMALEEGKLLGYVQQIPYIYEEHLRALYRFQEQGPCEEINAGIVTLSFGADIMFAENTLCVDEIGRLEYSLGKTKGNYTVFECWKANTAAMVIASFIEKQTGIKPSLDIVGGQKLQGQSLDYVIQNVVAEPEVKMLLADISAITMTEILAVLKKLYDAGKLNSLLKTIFHASGSFIMNVLTGIVGKELVQDSAAVVAGLAAICAAVALLVNQIQKNPPVPTPPKEKSKDKYRFLQVKTIQFRHSDDVAASAIPIVHSSRQAVEEPEWVSGTNSTESNPSLAAYISGKVQDVKLIVKFYYETNCNDSVTLNVYAEEIGASVLGEISEFSLSVSGSGDYEVGITLKKHMMRSLAAGKYASRYNWICSGEGLISVSYHKIYILPETPAKPWSIVNGQKQNNVTVGALELFSKVTNENRNMNEAAKMVHFLLDKEKFQYPEDTKSRFTDFNKDVVVFDQDKFDEALEKESRVTVNALDCSAIIVNHSALAGKKQSIMDIISEGEVNVVEMNGEIKRFPPFLYFEETMLLGEKEWKKQKGIDTHYVAADGENSHLKAVVYDGCMTGHGKGNKKIYAEGLLFSKIDSYAAGASDEAYYRETWFQEGCSSLISRKYALDHGRVPQKDENRSGNDFVIARTLFTYDNRIYIIPNTRFGFDGTIKNAIPIAVNQNRCHFISYSSMSDGIANSINGYLSGELKLEQAVAFLRGLRNIVFINNNGAGADRCFFSGSMNTLQEISILLQNYSATENKAETMEQLTNCANTLLYQLNNSLNNLRAANAAWNQSVQAAYDPAAWYYVGSDHYIYGDQTTLRYNNPIAAPANLPAFINEGFYLPDVNDGNRLNCLQKDTYIGLGLYFYEAIQKNTGYPLMYSSANEFPKPDDRFLCTFTLPIYYLWNNGWVQF